MDLGTLAVLLSVWIAAIASPGPDVVQIIRLGSRTRSDGVACALGIMLGNTLWIVGSLLGLSALVHAEPMILTVLKIIGGCYLLWMGVGAIRSGVRGNDGAVTALEGQRPVNRNIHLSTSFVGSLRLGILTNLSNPKALIFFAAIFAQFVQPGMNFVVAFVIASTLIITGIMWFVGVALVVHSVSSFLRRHSVMIEVICGFVFIVLALVMLYGGISELFYV